MICLHHSESLSAQLEVLNKHKETVEDVLKTVRKDSENTINECKKRVATVEMYNKKCNDGTEIKLLKEENERLKAVIEQLKLKEDKNVVNITAIEAPNIDKDDQKDDKKDQKVEADSYAKGPDVHFARQRPMNEILEFKRGQVQQQIPVDNWMEHKELVKKLGDREKEKAEGNVQDFRDLAKPDGQEEDYKEMH
ncbi:unnamed protein product [Bursaphelenchus okinawaensis]|uniref:Uncharacterized protein n=1 Tax=Bursaphelenchus okinawaensis TaxID=465554 RepID=A0A811KAQ4_9BILA|nr:unnamed protein product [Bursaphelenchus okinawaensis]CAG9094936.1 unnamed protein product [Bursaphelenchus okinawaensis]